MMYRKHWRILKIAKLIYRRPKGAKIRNTLFSEIPGPRHVESSSVLRVSTTEHEPGVGRLPSSLCFMFSSPTLASSFETLNPPRLQLILRPAVPRRAMRQLSSPNKLLIRQRGKEELAHDSVAMDAPPCFVFTELDACLTTEQIGWENNVVFHQRKGRYYSKRMYSGF